MSNDRPDSNTVPTTTRQLPDPPVYCRWMCGEARPPGASPDWHCFRCVGDDEL